MNSTVKIKEALDYIKKNEGEFKVASWVRDHVKDAYQVNSAKTDNLGRYLPRQYDCMETSYVTNKRLRFYVEVNGKKHHPSDLCYNYNYPYLVKLVTRTKRNKIANMA